MSYICWLGVFLLHLIPWIEHRNSEPIVTLQTSIISYVNSSALQFNINIISY